MKRILPTIGALVAVAALFLTAQFTPPPSSGGGSSAFSAITGGTNTAALVIGSGGSLGTSGSGTIAATTVALHKTYVWIPAAGNNSGGSIVAASITRTIGTAQAIIEVPASTGQLVSLILPVGAPQATYFSYQLPPTFTGTISATFLSSLRVFIAGTGTYVLNIATGCATIGTTPLGSISYGANQNITVTIATGDIGHADTLSPMTVPCTGGQLMVVRVIRDTTANVADTAADSVLFFGFGFTVSFT